ncbi:MAG: right-handed parallel beta-helix repeat-containing protein, partial [Candidatus Hodarchaeales archaeon]
EISIYLLESNHNLFRWNIVSNHTEPLYGYGITLQDFCSNNTFLNNSIRHNNFYGFMIDSTSFNNTIKWNDFINNNIYAPQQAFDNGTDNLFIFNYWDDHISSDIDNDGFSDDPYPLDGASSNTDPFPLTTSAFHELSIPLIVYPNGSETVSDEILIIWNVAIDSLDHNVTYDLYYSTDGGGSWVLIIAGLVEVNHTWDTNTVINGINYMIRVNASCDKGLWIIDDSDSEFTINNEPLSIAIDSPLDQVHLTDTITVSLSGNAVTYWYYIADFDSQNITWIINDPRILADGYYTLHAYGNNSAGNTVHETVSFRINNVPPVVTVIFPNGNETVDDIISITWVASDPENSTLFYYVSYWNGNSWINIAQNITENNLYWNTQTVIDRSDYRIRVNASDGYLVGVDESNDSFTIDNDPTFQQLPAGYTEFTFEEDYIIGIDVSGTVNITITTEVSNPPETPEELEPLDIYFNITLSDPDEIIDLWINISFNELGELNPENVRIYYYYEADGQWLPVKESGVDYQNEVVWGWTDHLTLFGVMDVQVQPPDLLPALILAFFIIVPVTVITLYIYRRTKRRLRLQKVKREVRKAQIDLGIIEDIETD